VLFLTLLTALALPQDASFLSERGDHLKRYSRGPLRDVSQKARSTMADYDTHVDLPTAVAGLIVGKNGVTINNIKKVMQHPPFPLRV